MMRLDKLISQAAAMSRTEAQAAIRKGRVCVDGQVCRQPERKTAPQAALLLDGQPLVFEEYVYLMLNKPAGWVSATEDTRDPAVTDLLPEALRRRALGVVGRLDKDATGLLLLTDNGQLNHRLTSPRYHMDKVYRVVLDRPAEPEDIEAFAAGIGLGDFTAMPARLEIDGEDPCRCRVTVAEGKFHQVKRMFAACGKTVAALHRESIGGVRLDGGLAPGEWRRLTSQEADFLLQSCGCAE